MENRSRGRPKKEPSAVINVRLPHTLLARLDRYLDLAEVLTGLRSNRNDAIRKALHEWLERHEPTLTRPPVSYPHTPPP